MSDLLKSAEDRRERADMDLQAYRALAREQAATIHRLLAENQDLRAELHSMQGDDAAETIDALVALRAVASRSSAIDALVAQRAATELIARLEAERDAARSDAEHARRWVDAAGCAVSALIAALEDLGVSPYNADGDAGEMVDPEDLAAHIKTEVTRLVRLGRDEAIAEIEAAHRDVPVGRLETLRRMLGCGEGEIAETIEALIRDASAARAAKVKP